MFLSLYLRIKYTQTIMSTESDNVQAMTETSQVTETLLEANIEQERAADNVPKSVAQPTGESASLLAKADDDVSTATIWSSVANMTNNVLGAGLVALPYSISQCTLVPGILLLIFMAFVASFSQYVIVSTCRLVDKYTYKEVGIAALGKTGGILISLIMLLYTTLSCTSYFVIIGDLLLGICGYFFPNVEFLQSRSIVVPCVCVAFIFPLCMMRTVDSLRYVSVVSVLAVVGVVVVIVQQFIEYHHVNETVEIMHWSSGFIRMVPVVCVSYNCHYNAPRYYKELKNRSMPRISVVVACSTLIVFLLYLAGSVCGYLQFGNQTLGDILKNYPSDALAPALGRLGLLVALVFTFPVAYFAVRNNLHTLFCSSLHFHGIWLRLATAVGVLLVTCTVAVFVEQVEYVIGFNGSLFGSCIMLIIPGLIYLRVDKTPLWKSGMKISALLLLCFGVVICVGGTYLTAVKLFAYRVCIKQAFPLQYTFYNFFSCFHQGAFTYLGNPI